MQPQKLDIKQISCLFDSNCKYPIGIVCMSMPPSHFPGQRDRCMYLNFIMDTVRDTKILYFLYCMFCFYMLRIFTPKAQDFTLQTLPETSILGSLEDSIFYCTARFFHQRAILCCHQNAVAKTSRVSK